MIVGAARYLCNERDKSHEAPALRRIHFEIFLISIRLLARHHAPRGSKDVCRT